MWWDQMFNWPTWVAVSLMTTLALGGLAWLIVLALRDEARRDHPASDGSGDVRLGHERKAGGGRRALRRIHRVQHTSRRFPTPNR